MIDSKEVKKEEQLLIEHMFISLIFLFLNMIEMEIGN